MMKFLSLILLLFGIFSCNSPKNLAKSEAIQSISVHIWGGMTGTDNHTAITKDLIVYDWVQTVYPNKNKSGAVKNTDENWTKIIAKVNLEEFEKIPNGSSHLVYDGVDTEITITTASKEYKVTNGEGNPAWDALIQEIENQTNF